MVVIGNPPYSKGQESQNDDNQNVKYDALDARIQATYTALSAAKNKNWLYDSYIRAIRWFTITQIYEGTNQIQRVVMARQLLK